MKNEKLTTFQKFNEQRSLKESEKAQKKKQTRLIKLTEEYHEAQRKLQDLERKYVESQKENKSEREELKEAIIHQKQIVESSKSKFEKEIGNEDIQDLKI